MSKKKKNTEIISNNFSFHFVNLNIVTIFHLFFFFFHSFTEIVPSFEPRDVTVKKGVDAKEFYDLLSEIGR